ncbi:MAG: hypothetical protein BIFFINMI_03656 [Phycisphaerae bacterium]|nr:hypothetical protein [Phycisphaerae bacterium]
MAHAYTPGLRVTHRTTVTKRRVLPLKGKVLKKVGDAVARDEVVARTELPGSVEILNLVGRLGITPDQVDSVLRKGEGDPVAKGELIAETRGLWGLFKSRIQSPIDGSIESVSKVTGQLLLRHPPIPVEVDGYVNGTVTAVIEGEGVEVSTPATFVQGIFGIGGETFGPLRFAAKDPGEVLTPDHVKSEHKGAIVVGGAFAGHAAIKRAIEAGLKGLVVGGIHDEDLRQILGYDLGVAITGAEQVGLTLILTEGFGQIRMSDRTWDALKRREGDVASISGATQIRAGVLRPEIIIPIEKTEQTADAAGVATGSAIDIGSSVRIIRQPNFGRVGVVSRLPSALQKIESETMARVLEVKFPDGTLQVIPRANIELIEE